MKTVVVQVLKEYFFDPRNLYMARKDDNRDGKIVQRYSEIPADDLINWQVCSLQEESVFGLDSAYDTKVVSWEISEINTDE